METKYIVNNLAEQTIDGDVIINGNFTITGTTNTRPYKVYTALLTQSGGDDIQSIDTGTITIGVTYRIANLSPGMDFTNVGAPNNEIDTYFVATGTTPASWGSAEDTGNSTLEWNTGAPVVTVLENTIGNIWFGYQGTGVYTLNSIGAFPQEKTFILTGVSTLSYIVQGVWNDENPTNSVFIGSYTKESFVTGTTENNLLMYTPIEIRVYN